MMLVKDKSLLGLSASLNNPNSDDNDFIQVTTSRTYKIYNINFQYIKDGKHWKLGGFQHNFEPQCFEYVWFYLKELKRPVFSSGWVGNLLGLLWIMSHY